MTLSAFFVAMLFSDTHLGKSSVRGLGEVALPEGVWKLRHLSSDRPEHAGIDVFVFEKLGTRFERLTFQGFPPTEDLSLGAYVDSIGDSTIRGVPRQFSDESNPHDMAHCGEFKLVRGQYVRASFFYSGEDADPWMSHSIVRRIDGRVWVLIHASGHAILPDTVFDVSLDSGLSGTVREAPTKARRD